MANVRYSKIKTEPSGRKLIFRRYQDNSIISDSIILSFNISVNQLAEIPIAKVQLVCKMLYPSLYEFENYGDSLVMEFNEVLTDFLSPDIKFRIKILDPEVELESEVIFKVTVMDAKEKDPFPLGGGFGFYSWEPIPPPTGTLLNATPNLVI